MDTLQKLQVISPAGKLRVLFGEKRESMGVRDKAMKSQEAELESN